VNRRTARNQRDTARQLQTLAELGALPPAELAVSQLEPVFEIAAHPANAEVQLQAAVLLSDAYPTLAPNDPEFAQRTHAVLLRDLLQPRKALAHPSCSWLVLTHLRAENLAHIPWRSAEEVANAAECFYGICDAGVTSDDSQLRVRDLVKYAGARFADQQNWEELFHLLARVQLPADLMDADLFRLRSLLVLFEQRRVQRMRRLLLLVMVAVTTFIVGASPLLFMLTENGYRSAQGQPPLGFFGALYWSIITAMTVGYGEIVPHTAHGRLLAVFDSLLGITVMGVVAGLILSHVTPRQLP